MHQDSIFTKEKILAEDFARNELAPTEAIDKCPFSGVKRHEILFSKWGVDYALCPESWSVALSARPSDEKIDAYFRDSPLAHYRASEDYQRSVAKGREALWAELLEWMEGRLFRYLPMEAYSILDYGPKIDGWVKQLQKARFTYHLAVEAPLPPIEEIAAKSPSDVVGLFDVLQRFAEPASALRLAYQRLKPGGLAIGTCRAGSGFDVLTLREASGSIFPLDHISLPSPLGMELLLQKCGFDVLEISTPGALDSELVRKAKDAIPRDQYFQRYLAANLDDKATERLQQFLQANGLSSHLRFVARRPEAA